MWLLWGPEQPFLWVLLNIETMYTGHLPLSENHVPDARGQRPEHSRVGTEVASPAK